MKDLTSPTAISFSWIALLLLGACVFIGAMHLAYADEGVQAGSDSPSRSADGGADGNRPPHLTVVEYAGDAKHISLDKISLDGMSCRNDKCTTIIDGSEVSCEGGFFACMAEFGAMKSPDSAKSIVWLKISVRAEDADGDRIRYALAQVEPREPLAVIGNVGHQDYRDAGEASILEVCFPQIDGGDFTFQVTAEDERGAKSVPQSITLTAVRSDKCEERKRRKQDG